MKTDELIELLSADVEPVRPGKLLHTLLLAVFAGVAAAACVMVALFGAPAHPLREPYFGVQSLTLVFTVTLVVLGMSSLIRSARPGDPGRRSLILIGLVFIGLISATIVAVSRGAPDPWGHMLFGPRWGICLICIPLFSLAPFAALVWALRRAAPTHLMRTGALIGLVAASSGAALFACCSPAFSLPFVALCYGGVIVLYSLLGAALGPWLLRW